jgi:hypothetical protein
MNPRKLAGLIGPTLIAIGATEALNTGVFLSYQGYGVEAPQTHV